MSVLDGGSAAQMNDGDRDGNLRGDVDANTGDSEPGVFQSFAGGEFERMLDEKGRITIPPRIRAALGIEYVTARGVEASVLVIPAALWPAIEASLHENLDGDENRYLRFAIHNRCHASLDRQGRLKLPKHLLEWASLAPGDAAAIVASGRKFVIWNRRVWTRFNLDAARNPLVIKATGEPDKSYSASAGGERS